MKITIVAVGKIKEKFYIQALAEYTKRLGRYCTLNVVEIPDEKAPENLSQAQMVDVLQKEGQKILSKVPSGALVVTMEIEGRTMTSEEFADYMDTCALNGQSHLCFIIGGSLGLHSDVKSISDLSLSFSSMTFPHQLFRILLLEQIYRAFRILRNEPYHK
ncbi:23S rRNA (pseudouridine(1915)-N(3))-methyltransferase RlmH [Alkalibacter rhizosphaerae]|uniref:Ribosomal RNA large subunit methyltransferase H n=1 Tax=Alkalibacter rhizosphaerae TaxID=2815577 RepID=A0A974XKR9_9FIRM|nr:23S rRNA (pseudouridine(1915)-N(3))-methyltransferase RlmH [Alkalibacter rhizosphaerae]QSX07771.1 23S rRNA (pseudouridine(1915)-N(3))-methyltransferase RlmH [Alkalibacter rhizosphaerae]